MILQLKLVSAWYGERLGTPSPLLCERVSARVARNTRIATPHFFLPEHPPSSPIPTFSTVNESSTLISTRRFLLLRGERLADFRSRLTDAKFDFFFIRGIILSATFRELESVERGGVWKRDLKGFK